MINGKFETITIRAGLDLDTEALQYAIVDINGVLAVNGGVALGVSIFRPKDTEPMTVAYEGHMKARAGAAITKGARLTVNGTGRLITAVATSFVVGRALEATTADGDIIQFIGNFSNTSQNNV